MSRFKLKLRSCRGFTFIELLIALGLTSIITFAALQFYTSLNQQSISQQEMADIQQVNRACLEEISTALRSAGYGLSTHPAYEVAGDSLFVYLQKDHPVDTIAYFLEEFTSDEYLELMGENTSATSVYKLMRKMNSDTAQVFADYLTDMRITVINSKLVAVTLETQSSRPDDTYPQNNGYRRFTNTDRVVIRNIF
jgi:prepilin-type N-terminal cleavage/methylation domain-containing protein